MPSLWGLEISDNITNVNGAGGGRMAVGDAIQSKALFYFRSIGSLQNKLWKVPAKMELREILWGRKAVHEAR